MDTMADADGKADPCPKQDMDFMYGHSFEDPDSHIWEPMWMSERRSKRARWTCPTAADRIE